MSAPVFRLVNSQDEKVEIDYNIAKQYFQVLSHSNELREMMDEIPESEFSSDDSVSNSDEDELENDAIEVQGQHANGANAENNKKTNRKEDDDDSQAGICTKPHPVKCIESRTERNDNVNDNANDNNQDVEMTNLMYKKITLEYIVNYALLPESEKKASALKPPLNTSLETFLSEEEYNLLMEAFKKDILLELYSAAIYLEFNELIQMCAAFLAEKIAEISMESSDIMSNAEKVRKLLKMENTWTEEEQQHLRREMEYVQQHWKSIENEY